VEANVYVTAYLRTAVREQHGWRCATKGCSNKLCAVNVEASDVPIVIHVVM
jgi:hypothetical protein